MSNISRFARFVHRNLYLHVLYVILDFKFREQQLITAKNDRQNLITKAYTRNLQAQQTIRVTVSNVLTIVLSLALLNVGLNT